MKITCRLGRFDFTQWNGQQKDVCLIGCKSIKLDENIDNKKLTFKVGGLAELSMFLYNVNEDNEIYGINGRAGILLAKLDALKLEIVDGTKTGNVILEDDKLHLYYNKNIKCTVYCDSFEHDDGTKINFVRLIPEDNGELGLIYLNQMAQAKAKARLDNDAMNHLDASLDTIREQEFNKGIENYTK